MHYVNLYQTTQCFGGHEEGGWWYTEGTYHSCEGAYSKEEQALDKMRRIEENLKKAKTKERREYRMGKGPHDGVDPDGNGDDNYLMRGGAWGYDNWLVRVQEHVGENFPQTRPTYE